MGFSLADSLPLAESLPIVLTLIGMIGAYIGWRKSERRFESEKLRKNDVYSWSNQSISVLQKLSLITSLDKNLKKYDKEEMIEEIIFDSSILIEQGRLLFKNEQNSDGSEKEEAYRGFRPRILDQLVIAHQIALAWIDFDPKSRWKLAKLADNAKQKFVSLAQLEVGRSVTAHESTAIGGVRVNLSTLLAELDT